jgi:hypothetical protein
MSGTLFAPDGAHKVIIRDISRTGALIAAETRISPDCDAIFKRGSVFAAARIAWSDEKEAGLRFYRELTQAEVDSTLHSVVAFAA